MFVGFCSEDHAKAAIRVGQVSACSKCNNLPATLGGNLCPACDRRLQLETAEPRLEELEPRDLSFQSGLSIMFLVIGTPTRWGL